MSGPAAGGPAHRGLTALAALHRVQPAYRGVDGRRHRAPPETLLATLQALGAPVATMGDVPPALREARAAVWRRLCEPVAVAWEGRPSSFELRLPAVATGHASCRLVLEDGSDLSWSCALGSLARLRSADVEGVPYAALALPLPAGLPCGYHRLTVEAAGRTATSLVIAAPRRAWEAPARRWGVFAPLHAIHGPDSWGAGNLADLAALAAWTGARGGSVVGLLPLLAAFLDEPFDPSPYAPASRLFWNEFYLDLSRAPEAAGAGVASEAHALRAAPLVDYRRGMALRRRVLGAMARHCCARPESRAAVERWVAGHPAVRDYARFRATGQRRGDPWPEWPEPLRSGILRDGDWDPAGEWYHLYAQWLAERQVAETARAAAAAGSGLYLDLPLGAHAAGYDVWRHRSSFAPGATVGAPPDAIFRGGQDWGFPPPHPEGLRAAGYAYLAASLRHQLRYARALRLDHVMGLHRLFWIPRGGDATVGVYVRYHAEELYAVLTLESARAACELVGEDLGVVPAYVRAALRRHGLRRLYVATAEVPAEVLSEVTAEVPAEVPAEAGRPLGDAPRAAVAMLATHDMPPFAAWWAGLEPAARRAVAAQLRREGWLTDLGGERDEPSPAAALAALLARLAAGPATILLVALEELWGEARPQNVPGTGPEEPNWRRRARYGLQELDGLGEVGAALRRVRELRPPEAAVARPAAAVARPPAGQARRGRQG